LNVDTGGERFGPFLPVINVPVARQPLLNGRRLRDVRRSRPDSAPPPTWRCIEMQGMAQTIEFSSEVALAVHEIKPAG